MVLQEYDNVSVVNQHATFDPPIDGILILQAPDANSEVSINSKAITINLGAGPGATPSGQFGSGALIPLGGCTFIQGHTNLKYLAIRKRIPNVVPNDTLTSV